MQTEKLVSLPLRKWRQMRNEGFDIPLTDFNENLFLKSMFKRKHPADLLALMADKTVLVLLVSIFKIYFSKDELESIMVNFVDNDTKFVRKIKAILILSHPDYKGPINMDVDLSQLECIINKCSEITPVKVEQQESILAEEVTKPKKSARVSK